MTTVARPIPHLLQDGRLPSLESAWSRGGRLAFLNDQVLPVALPGERARAVTIEDMTYSPGRECVVLYALSLEGRERASRWVVATFAKDDRLADVFTRQYASLPPGAAVLLPESRCLVELFPADWKLPRLAPVVDPARAGALLARIARRRGRGRAPEVTVVRYRPHQRCVLRYALPEGDVIGKVFRYGRKAALSFHVMGVLHARASSLGIAVPEPLAFVRSSNLVLMERLAGTSLKQALGAIGPRRAAEFAELAAGALVRLHGLQAQGGEERSFRGELAQLRRRAARFGTVAPALGQDVDAILERLEALTPVLGWRGRSFVHGDFKPSQLLLDGGRLGLVDFDRAARGDPALDVGNFMAQFRKETVHGDLAHLRRLPARFLEAYERISPRRPVAERARCYEALALTRMAIRSFRRSPHVVARSGADSTPVRLLEEARRCLDAL